MKTIVFVDESDVTATTAMLLQTKNARDVFMHHWSNILEPFVKSIHDKIKRADILAYSGNHHIFIIKGPQGKLGWMSQGVFLDMLMKME